MPWIRRAALAFFPLFLLLSVIPPGFAQRGAAALEGTWQGRLAVPVGPPLTVVFHFERGSGGSFEATMDSPDQGASGMVATEIVVDGNALKLKVPDVGGAYAGRIQPGAQRIEGTWHQAGLSLALTLERIPAAQAATVRRPQRPHPPFPYATEAVSFTNPAGNITLSGTLTLPRGDGPHPAMVLISGSGPQDRNSMLMGHEPFLLWADVLTRQGIAVLRFDDRGVGGSTGDWAQTTLAQRAADVRAAMRLLKRRSDIAAEHIGLLGHSEGAVVASMVAARSDDVDFLVLLSAPAVPGDELLARQNALIFEANGMSAQGASNYAAALRQALQPVIALPAHQPLPAELRQALRAKLRSAADAMSSSDRAVYASTDAAGFAATLDRLVDALAMPSIRSFLRHDPRPALRQVKAPVLAIYGSKDLQVPPQQNVPALRAALAANPETTIEVLAGLNHLLQPAHTGLPSEYGRIETTIAPKVLDMVGHWIAERRPAAHDRPGAQRAR